MLRPGGVLVFAGEPSRYGDRHRRVPKRAALPAAPAVAAAAARAAGARTRHGDGADADDDHDLEPFVDVHAFDPPTCARFAGRAGFGDVKVRGEELLANWFGWVNRDARGDRRARRRAVGRGASTRSAATCAPAARPRLLEPRLPPAIFYNLIVSRAQSRLRRRSPTGARGAGVGSRQPMHTRTPRVRRRRASSDHHAGPRPRALGSTTGRPRTAAEEQRRIAAACEHLQLELVAVLADPAQALDRLDAGEASCLVVSRLEALAPDVDGLAEVLDRIEANAARLVALDVALDSDTATGQLALARREPPPEPEPEAEAEVEPEAEPEPEPAADAPAPPEPAPEPAAPAPPATVAIGYASAPGEPSAPRPSTPSASRSARPARLAASSSSTSSCDREPSHGKALDRAGLTHALERIAAGEATCLVVVRARPPQPIGGRAGPARAVVERNSVRLVALDIDLDTADEAGRTAPARSPTWATGSASGCRSARARAWRPPAPSATRGDGAARSGGSTTRPAKRIAAMRADGMTLQAIADTLNAEGVPTRAGGREWRPSSVQTAAGYRRRSRARDRSPICPRSPREPPKEPELGAFPQRSGASTPTTVALPTRSGTRTVAYEWRSPRSAVRRSLERHCAAPVPWQSEGLRLSMSRGAHPSGGRARRPRPMCNQHRKEH